MYEELNGDFIELFRIEFVVKSERLKKSKDHFFGEF
jgi:hypothetical protein